MVGYDAPVGGLPVLAGLYIIKVADGYVVEVGHLAIDVALAGFFLKEEAAAVHAVLQREGPYFHGPVFVDEGVAMGIDGVEYYVEVEFMAEQIELSAQKGLQFLLCVDVEVFCASQQSKGGYEAYESEAVVAVEVRDEYIAHGHEFNFVLSHLELCAFAAVDER